MIVALVACTLDGDMTYVDVNIYPDDTGGDDTATYVAPFSEIHPCDDGSITSHVHTFAAQVDRNTYPHLGLWTFYDLDYVECMEVETGDDFPTASFEAAVDIDENGFVLGTCRFDKADCFSGFTTAVLGLISAE